MRHCVLLVFVLCCGRMLAQADCNCNADFQFVVTKIEKEHPGFSGNVNAENVDRYKALKDSIRNNLSVASAITKEDCRKNINKYLNFIKDKHLQIYDPKLLDEDNYEATFVSKHLPKYQSLDDATGYVKIPSFNFRLWKELDAFYDSIAPILKNKTKIIVDVRNNGGGGERMYNQLVNLLNSASREAKIGLIFNRKCVSACEELVLILSKNKKIRTFGQNTNGQFAYGFIKTHKTPNCALTFITTTKKYSDRIKYEYIGLSPTVRLEPELEPTWISIVSEILDQ